MSYLQLAYLHLATVLPAFVIGAFLLWRTKGTPTHKAFGRVYVVLMMVTVALTLFMPAHVGPTVLDHWGFIHILSVVVLICLPLAVWAARQGDIATHRANMLGVYCGGILVAGTFAFMPGRLLHGWIFGG